MISKVTHMCVYVLNQESAADFYTNKLGFNVKIDVPMGPDTRWLTVTPPEQSDLEITLFPLIAGKMFTEEKIKMLKELVSSGTFGPCVFSCNDIYATYEELKGKGVEFIKPPTKEFFALEALFKDDSGNFFSLQQRT
ncbi:VOC family protein [Pedobacter fastidiosus]|uniref:VOC family protein n=1 Tax=Pedobacter fastidiosus TaxID=2765361 RepID=A0ABR7KY57_9SPHI|nr:VOC family protein [Pedobacter fastidiosus]MBC6113016.1 VOC family protein [Pedobacter fastidiosus]